MFCPECKSMLVSSRGQLKCRKCGYIRKIKAHDKAETKPPEPLLCFCHKYRCPQRDHTLCPKGCDEASIGKACPQGPCQLHQQHPEECEKLSIKLLEEAGEKPKYIPDRGGYLNT